VKTVVVLSGKGGTGKTSVTAALAALEAAAGRTIVLADTDVDAANLHLLLEPTVLERNDFVGGQVARVDPATCRGHGECAAHCRFDAIRIAASPEGPRASIDPTLCEGCAVCTLVCPERAIAMHDEVAGSWRIGMTALGPMVDARLGSGGENSGKLVTRVRQAARDEAERTGAELVLMDGPPGVGCPVIAAVTGTDLVVAVTEPTPPARSDLQRLITLARHFNVPVAVVVNKADLNPEMAAALEASLAMAGVEVLGRIPYDEAIPRAQTEGRTPLEAGEGPRKALEAIHGRFRAVLEGAGRAVPGLLQIDTLGVVPAGGVQSVEK